MNKDSSKEVGRREVLGAVGSVLAVTVGSGVVGATAPKPQKVAPGLARKAAELQREIAAGQKDFETWEGASLGSRDTFYMLTSETPRKYTKSAYVFPVEKGGVEVGYVTTGAQRRLPPILEFSSAESPTARRPGDGKPLYHGGVSYAEDLGDGTVQNVLSGRQKNVRTQQVGNIAADSARARSHWKQLDPVSKDKDGSSTNDYVPDIPSGSNADYVYSVPCWSSSDEGGASSTSIGTGRDSWKDWDGCAPIAGSMVIGYHENVNEWEDNEREAIIDNLHNTMKSGDGLVSNPIQTEPQHIDDGFKNYDFGSNSYGAKTYYITDHGLVRSEIGKDQPFQLNMTSGDRAEDETSDYKLYGDHSVAVSGYVGDGSQLHIHDTWNDEPHRLNWGNWSACSITAVWTK
jgi:hypothetical protein